MRPRFDQDERPGWGRPCALPTGRLFPRWPRPQPRLLQTWNLRFPGSASGATSASRSASGSVPLPLPALAPLSRRGRALLIQEHVLSDLFPSPPCAGFTPRSIFWRTQSLTSWHHVVPAGLLVPQAPWGGPAGTRAPASAPHASSRPASNTFIYGKRASMLDASPQINSPGAGPFPSCDNCMWWHARKRVSSAGSKRVGLVFLHGTRHLWGTKFRASDGGGEKEGTMDLGIHLK